MGNMNTRIYIRLTFEEIELIRSRMELCGIKWLLRMTDSTFEIVTFSKILNELDFYEEKPEKFRSTGSIRMKLANFMSLDKRYNKNSLGNVGKSDKLIWEKYHDNPNTLHDECREIINEHLKRRLYLYNPFKVATQNSAR